MALHDAEPDAAGPLGASAWEIEREVARTLASYGSALRRVLGDHGIPPQDGEDLVQEALLLAVTKWPQIRSLGPWLYGTLRHRCTGYWRQRRREAVEVHLDPAVVEHLLPGEAPIGQEQRERRMLLNGLAHTLPLRYRRLLMLRFQLGLQDAEVAAATGYSATSVGKMVQRAVALLRQAEKSSQPSSARRAASPAAGGPGDPLSSSHRLG
jgi:RNA polymerase sigma factor (sigma-70 family)